MNIVIQSGKGDRKKETNVSLKEDMTVLDLKKAYSSIVKKPLNQISFKISVEGKKEVKLDDDKQLLKNYNLDSKSVLIFKDLGPQIGYRTVFLVEYFGPMLFVALYSLRPSFLYGEEASMPYNWVAKTAVVCWILHFLKREYETIFVHKFSHPTMPLSNLFKNCAYYWIFGAVIGYPLCSPKFVPPSDIQAVAGLAIFVVSEIGNYICHIMLSNMRPSEGSQDRKIPRGFLFEYVACPNYTFEILTWIGFSIMTQLPFSYLFTLVGFIQMADWAKKKHQGYKATFDKEYTKLKRKAIVPFIY